MILEVEVSVFQHGYQYQYRFYFVPVAGVRNVEVEVPGLEVSQRPPGGHVRGGHARASLTRLRCDTDILIMTIPGDSDTR